MSIFSGGARRLNWFRLYFALAGFELLSLVAGLCISGFIIGVFSASVLQGQAWSLRLEKFNDLAHLAAKVIEPATAAYLKRVTTGQPERLASAHAEIKQLIEEIDVELEHAPEREIASDLQMDLNSIDLAATALVLQSQDLLKSLDAGQPETAGRLLATVTNRYSDLISLIQHIDIDILTFEKEQGSKNNSIVERLHKFEWFGAGIVLFVLIGMIYYGRRVAQSMQAADRESEIQKQKLTEQAAALNLAVEAAEAASVAKSRFLANMSHEIRTPMNGVLGMTDLLLRSGLDTKQHHFAEMIYRSGTTLLAIINDILDISRIEAAKFELERTDFDVHSCVTQTIGLLSESAGRKFLTLNLVIAPDVPAFANGDAGRLRQVLMNLVGNAIKFTSMGVVELTVKNVAASERDVSLEFRVRDTGIGIDEDKVPLLFRPFAQADSSITRRFGGTGLGLSISQSIIQMMGGEVSVQSQPGVGTEVTFFVVLAQAEHQPAAKPENGLDLEGKSILVVDDRQANREILCAYISQAGGFVETAVNGGQAVDKLLHRQKSGEPYDVAIIDMQLPDISGFDIAKSLNQGATAISTKLIMLSSGAAPEQSRDARALGFQAFLMKPILRRDLVAAVTDALNAPRALPAQHAATAEGLPMEGVHVLVAEDNPVNLEVARQYLADLGCQVTAVGNGQEALDACQSTHFDIVLMDCQMPVLDGLEAVRRLRAREKASGTMPLRIIAITANAFAEDRKNCLDAGMDDYLSKPFSAEQLLVKLHKWVETRTATTAALSLLKKPTLDSDLIAAMRGSRPEFFDRLIDLFTSHAPSAMGQLVTGREACNAKAVGQAAHSLKSSCGNIGAMHMSDLCAQVQRAANSGWNSEKLLPVLDEIEGEFVRVMSALAEQRAKQPRLAAMA